MPEFDPDSLRRAMRDAGIQGKALAAKVKVSRSHLSCILNARKPCPDALAARLARALGVDKESLYSPTKAEKKAKPILGLSAAEQAAVEALRALPAAIRGPMVNCLLSLAAGTAEGEVPSGPQSPEYWQRRRGSLHEMLNEADRLHAEAVRRASRGDQPPEVAEP